MEYTENKLKNYRLRKRRNEKIQRFKESIKKLLMLGVKPVHPNETTLISDAFVTDESFQITPNSLSDVDDGAGSDDVSFEEEAVSGTTTLKPFDSDRNILRCAVRIVYFAIWVTLYIIAIELQFGTVFLMVSALAGIYLNTRTGPKKEREISAYSVFNKNCESIDGTLKAEQFEREIGIR